MDTEIKNGDKNKKKKMLHYSAIWNKCCILGMTSYEYRPGFSRFVMPRAKLLKLRKTYIETKKEKVREEIKEKIYLKILTFLNKGNYVPEIDTNKATYRELWEYSYNNNLLDIPYNVNRTGMINIEDFIDILNIYQKYGFKENIRNKFKFLCKNSTNDVNSIIRKTKRPLAYTFEMWKQDSEDIIRKKRLLDAKNASERKRLNINYEVSKIMLDLANNSNIPIMSKF